MFSKNCHFHNSGPHTQEKGYTHIYSPAILSPMSIVCSISLRSCSSFAVLSSWCSAAHLQDEGPLLTGTPLSEPEYDQFFKPLRAPYRASATCLIRALYGCQNPLIRRLDQYENHGVIPQGPVCSDLPEIPFFADFCTFTFYRCTMKKYFVKRVICPEEIQSKSGRTRTFSEDVTASDRLLPPTKPSPQSSTSTRPLPPSGTGAAAVKDILLPTSPQSNSHTRILLIFSQSPPKPQSIPENSPVNQISEEAESGQHQGELSSPQESHLPTSDMEDLFLRLQDPNVQHWMQAMQVLLAKLKTAGEQELQATSLKLLMALNHADIQQEAKPTAPETVQEREKAAGRERP
uniref:Acrosin-binding protein n=1 Tax=Chrysemys picta bellii TaxID=8478 RepID=A0A8C3IV40_CHRPI